MYRCPDDGEWVGYNTVVHLSAAVASIVIIDEDTNGGASTDVKGKVPL
jgi:hypothetical protein